MTGVKSAVEHASQDGIRDSRVREAVLGNVLNKPLKDYHIIGILLHVPDLLIGLGLIVKRPNDVLINRR